MIERMFTRIHSMTSAMRRNWLTVAFVLGFITDFILLNRIDDLVDNLILLFYVILATTTFLLLYVGVAERGPGLFTRLLRNYMPILMQYAFGGLLSGMLIFYGRSGDLIASAPFLALILAVIIGNEFVQKSSDRLVYSLGLYFIGIYSYIVLVVPVITGRMGDGIFILSGLIALVIVSVVVQILYRIVPKFMALNTKRIIITIGAIYIGFNSLYFTSLIPPIPLSITNLEIAHSVDRLSNGSYRVVSEEQPFHRKLPFWNPVLRPSGSSIACFSSVYAPTNLSTEIFHHWEYQDEAGKWRQHFRMSYPIAGTNDSGYRGYTEIGNFFDGTWRCSVETRRGQVLGREIVHIDTNAAPEDLVTRIE